MGGRIVVGLCAVAGLTGCGASEEDRVQQVVRDYAARTRRLATGDYDIAIDGDTATAQGTNLGNFTLRKIDGDWKLTSVY